MSLSRDQLERAEPTVLELIDRARTAGRGSGVDPNVYALQVLTEAAALALADLLKRSTPARLIAGKIAERRNDFRDRVLARLTMEPVG